MLNNETRRRIDACRDILVGKLPDPKSQVEQITLALMYKFMNDMDHEAVDLGGQPQFFAGEYADFSWDRITDQRLGGAERIGLYSRGIEAVTRNPAVPALFQEIFKNAFLPYRDPETFNLFAKEINGFAYEHSEDLGDAFEYLLSIMSSQGDAGQFRTPRHIIDFMVEALGPRSDETILDPACGTAGFLIAAYKFIRRSEARLSPGQLERLHGQIEGYDISPDMVRLSRVNLYLHQFPDPQVHEYDTLTDLARWADKADVVLANPPFMTPKGGIRPHGRFGITSNRSEVLFVDYIMEHLRPDGRAAVIVPEGIIFQSAGAYRKLRAALLDGYLWGVVSLPAGVFNPYSGVKTSILLIDRKLARQGYPVLFAKVEADGYDLGAQRRASAKNDLPAAISLLRATHARLLAGGVPWDFHGSLDDHTAISHLLVPRSVIKAEADCNFSGERYRPKVTAGPRKWPMVKLGEVFRLSSGRFLPQKNQIPGNYEVFGGNGVNGKHDEFFIEKPTLIIGRVGENCGSVHITTANAWVTDNALLVTDYLVECHQDYLFSILQKLNLNQHAKRGGQPSISQATIYDLEIPLPPLSVQEEIVAEIRRYQAVIDGAQAVEDNWRPSFAIDPAWPVVKLGEVCRVDAELTREIDPQKFYIGADSIESNSGRLIAMKTCEEQGTQGPVFYFSGKRILYSKIRPYLNKLTLIDSTGYCSSDMYPLNIDQQKTTHEFMYNFLLSADFLEKIKHHYQRASIPKINQDQLFSVSLPLPPLQVQEEIVARIEAERALVKANEELIALMKRRIAETMERVWQ